MKKPRVGFTLIELLVVITIIGILIALLLPAVQAAREAARRLQCANHLKQLSLGVLNFEHLSGHFPSSGWGKNWTGDPDRGIDREQPGGWFYSILPHIEQLALYQLGADGDADNWTTMQLAGAARRIGTPLEIMNCPTRRPAILYSGGHGDRLIGTDPVTVMARGDYAICVGDPSTSDVEASGPSNIGAAASYSWRDMSTATGISFQRSRVLMAMVSDGTSCTYMLGEKYLSPDNYSNGADDGDNEDMYDSFNNDICRSTNLSYPPMQDQEGFSDSRSPRFGSAHSTGLHMSFCDGSVQFINYAIVPEVHRRLGNRSDGLAVSGNQF